MTETTPRPARRTETVKIEIAGAPMTLRLVPDGDHGYLRHGKRRWLPKEHPGTLLVRSKVFEVTADAPDGKLLGTVSLDRFTFERKTPGRMYVNSRWEAPRWAYEALTPGGPWNAEHRYIRQGSGVDTRKIALMKLAHAFYEMIRREAAQALEPA